MIREISIEDAADAARLSEELGYPVDISTMEHRILALPALHDHTVFVACRDNKVVGWIDVGLVHHLQSGAYGEIGGLVVSAACRSEGIGAQLILRAEQWVAGQGVSRILVRTQIAREAAQRFYARHGYVRTKTSAVFSKTLPAL